MDDTQIQQLEQRVETLEQQLRSFLNVGELDPQIVRTVSLIPSGATIDSVGGTSGVLQNVDESGSSSYNVAGAFDGTVVIKNTDGTQYKLGYYDA